MARPANDLNLQVVNQSRVTYLRSTQNHPSIASLWRLLIMAPGTIKKHLGRRCRCIASKAVVARDLNAQILSCPQNILLQFWTVQGHLVMCGHARFPAKGLEVTRHRADGVNGAVDQVDAAVISEVHSKTRPAGGHELEPAHGAFAVARKNHG